MSFWIDRKLMRETAGEPDRREMKRDEKRQRECEGNE